MSRTGDLDRRVAGLGSEQGLIEGLGENCEELSPAQAAAIEAREAQESTACCQRRLAWNSALASGRKPGQPMTSRSCGTSSAHSSGDLARWVVVSQAALGLGEAADKGRR